MLNVFMKILRWCLFSKKCCTVGNFGTVLLSTSPCRWQEYQCFQSSVHPCPWGERASCLPGLESSTEYAGDAPSAMLHVTVFQEFFKMSIHLVQFMRNKITLGWNRYRLKFYSSQFSWGSIFRPRGIVADIGEAVHGNTSSLVAFPFSHTMIAL
jgi:hypothetical protein